MSVDSRIEDILSETKKAMIIGIGGGGDIVGTLPTANLLKICGIESVLGGLSWERSVFDPLPGPRKFEEVRNAEKINQHVWYVNEKTETLNGVRFAESGVSQVTGQKTLMIDINSGPRVVSRSLLDAADELGCDLIVGIDVGGDAVAIGTEKGLMSPLADSVMVSSLYSMRSEIKTVMGIFGFGSDGELSIDELEYIFKIISGYGGVIGSWGITSETLKLMQEVVSVVPTEASRAPVEYALGMFENSTIRSGTRQLNLNLCSTSTYYLDVGVVYEKISRTSRAVAGAKDLEDAHEKLKSIGIRTELDIERENFEKLS